MIYEFGNEGLKVKVSTGGGELLSMCDSEGKEYVWQGDPAIWKSSAPNLFPYIARLTDMTCTFEGSSYHMKNHGFLKYMEMDPVSCQGDTLVMKLDSCPETLAQYPFVFTIEIMWQVKGSTLEITYRVKNRDNKTMYFGLGGHPGFQVPMEDGLAFTDYYLDFGTETTPTQMLMSQDCYMNGEEVPYALRDGRYLDLHHDLFDHDAIILRDMPRQVTLGSAKGSRALRVEFPDMTYVGFWHKPETQAPYVCIEPWTSLPSRKGVIEDLATQENLVSLGAGEVYENRVSITIL